MVRRSLSYADAVRLLSRGDNKLRNAFERVASFFMSDATPGGLEVLAWFGAKNELVGLSRELVARAVARGVSEDDRASRLEAAHTVIVVAAFFESLTEVRLPIEITSREQLALAGADLAGIGDFAHQIQSVGWVVPSPVQARESFRTDLHVYYLELTDRLHQFIRGLSDWDALPAMERRRITRELGETADRATDRYQESLRRLAADFPEIQAWVGFWEHRPDTPEGLHELATRGGTPDAAVRKLALAYRSVLDSPILRFDNSFAPVVSPTVEQAYISPMFRFAVLSRDTPVSDESWWMSQPLREDVEEFLAAYLTSAEATRAPVMVLGHPGAGKSLLTEVLAARLRTDRFLPVRVPLRAVSADSYVDEQIEQAIHMTIGEPARWSEVALAAGRAQPVLLLDGLDEVLQATGTHISSYLQQVQRFQRDQAAIGRPLAAIVTSRTIVADRVDIPAGTTAVRLESFNESQVSWWLDTWNHANAEVFAQRGLSPLVLEAVLANGDLAMQPLLLLALALYDADDNALQRRDTDVSPHRLYGRLLRTFASREASKMYDGSSGRHLEDAVDVELSKLSVAAFAMFNRGQESATDVEIQADLDALRMADPPRSQRSTGPLATAEQLLGRFYFIHQSQASASDFSSRTYEFLHASFAEYLVAWFTWKQLLDTAAIANYSRHPITGARFEDDILRTLLTHRPLSCRIPILTFLEGFAGESQSDHDNVRRVLMTLFQNVDRESPHSDRNVYGPRSSGGPARYANYAANLVLLSLCTGAVTASELYPDRPDPVTAWRDLTLFWRSQIPADGWRSLVDIVALERIQEDGRRDVRLTMGFGPQHQNVDLAWMLVLERGQRGHQIFHANIESTEWLTKEIQFQCGVPDALMLHALEPLSTALPDTATTVVGSDQNELQSVAHALIEVWVNPSPSAYSAAAAIAAPSWTSEENLRFWSLLLDRLCTGVGADPETAAAVLTSFVAAVHQDGLRTLADVMLRCVLTYLGRNREADRVLARLVDIMFDEGLESADSVLAVDTLVRMYELRLPVARSLEVLRGGSARLLKQVAPIRPDLQLRLQALIDREG
ncbi:NACHT domain-containing protein [Amycolatopsis sp. NPDC003865]